MCIFLWNAYSCKVIILYNCFFLQLRHFNDESVSILINPNSYSHSVQKRSIWRRVSTTVCRSQGQRKEMIYQYWWKQCCDMIPCCEKDQNSTIYNAKYILYLSWSLFIGDIPCVELSQTIGGLCAMLNVTCVNPTDSFHAVAYGWAALAYGWA